MDELKKIGATVIELDEARKIVYVTLFGGARYSIDFTPHKGLTPAQAGELVMKIARGAVWNNLNLSGLRLKPEKPA